MRLLLGGSAPEPASKLTSGDIADIMGLSGSRWLPSEASPVCEVGVTCVE